LAPWAPNPVVARHREADGRPGGHPDQIAGAVQLLRVVALRGKVKLAVWSRSVKLSATSLKEPGPVGVPR